VGKTDLSRASAETSDRLLTRQEAARFLGISPKTLANWASTGRNHLPIIKIGGRLVRYRQSDLDAFATANQIVKISVENHDE
jgi:excisionase family DNA binding protein